MNAALPKPKAQKVPGPYGWEFWRDEEGGLHPQPLATELWVIRHIRQLYAFGCDLDEIAGDLRADRIRPRHGGRWSREELVALLRRDDTRLWEHWQARQPIERPYFP